MSISASTSTIFQAQGSPSLSPIQYNSLFATNTKNTNGNHNNSNINNNTARSSISSASFLLTPSPPISPTNNHDHAAAEPSFPSTATNLTSIPKPISSPSATADDDFERQQRFHLQQFYHFQQLAVERFNNAAEAHKQQRQQDERKEREKEVEEIFRQYSFGDNNADANNHNNNNHSDNHSSAVNSSTVSSSSTFENTATTLDTATFLETLANLNASANANASVNVNAVPSLVASSPSSPHSSALSYGTGGGSDHSSPIEELIMQNIASGHQNNNNNAYDNNGNGMTAFPQARALPQQAHPHDGYHSAAHHHHGYNPAYGYHHHANADPYHAAAQVNNGLPYGYNPIAQYHPHHQMSAMMAMPASTTATTTNGGTTSSPIDHLARQYIPVNQTYASLANLSNGNGNGNNGVHSKAQYDSPPRSSIGFINGGGNPNGLMVPTNNNVHGRAGQHRQDMPGAEISFGPYAPVQAPTNGAAGYHYRSLYGQDEDALVSAAAVVAAGIKREMPSPMGTPMSVPVVHNPRTGLVDELDFTAAGSITSIGRVKSTSSSSKRSSKASAPYDKSSRRPSSSNEIGGTPGTISISTSTTVTDVALNARGFDELEMPLTNVRNPLGGGRGYVPGETPDDPSKRHHCGICGRGFARLYNLKSHAQTHDPERPKPYACPHAPCNKSFSRLHDLERHRQGIHNDGPLVDAKRQGVTPALARAQLRIVKRAERGDLI